ncbi:MAG: EAL domain-containing protein, partial [Spirochaetales bacterium]|nr:EAL domain-containing protein [Spirochaetales bacterium]
RTFKASVTAEGVETKEQADFLKSIGCDEIQGYYFSRPLPPEALEEFLNNE